MLVLLFLLSLVISSAHLKCGHVSETDLDLQFMTSPEGRSLAESGLRDTSAMKPIRIYFHYLDMNMSSILQDEFKNQLMKTVQNFYTNRLMVYPFKENLKLVGKTMCSSVKIPKEHSTIGIPADLIIYVFGNSYNTESWVARAGACILDSAPYNNILAGKIEINTSQYSSNLAFEDKMQTVIHEIFHILGFSNSLYQYFHKEDGTKYSSTELTQTTTLRGKSVTILKTPTVVAKAQAAFGCTTMLGLELEDGGGSGTAGSHWEKRMMFNDFMIGDIGPTDILYTDITFAVLKDSGWYDINWDYTDSIYYGKGKGCEFYENKCVINSVPQFDEFCDEGMQSSKCNYTRLYKGFCNKISNPTTLPTAMQYFGNPSIGGSDKYLDYCPIVVPFANGSCRGNSAVTTTFATGAGEVIGMKSRCLDHTLLSSQYTYSNQYKSTRAGCYSIRCEGSSYYVTVGTTEVKCTAGQEVTISGYNGKLICPEVNEVCGSVPCPLGCRGVGKCINGVCQCDEGYSGDDCSVGNGKEEDMGNNSGNSGGDCAELCMNCSSSSCITCKTNANKNESGVCVCSAGYINLSGSCSLASSSGSTSTSTNCPSLCQTCSSPFLCITCKPNSAKNSSGSCMCSAGYINLNGSCSLLSSSGSTSNSTNCPTLCKTCFSPFSCITCKPNSVKNSSGSCGCIAGYININGSCTLASNASLIYSITSLNDCPSLCTSCTSNSICTACKPNASKTPDGLCLCDSGYSLSNNSCILSCINTCRECSLTDPSYCTSCSSNSHLSSGSCVCDSDYTLNSTTGQCLSSITCPLSCASCSTTTQCLSCKSGYNYWPLSHSCQSSCPSSFILNNSNTCTSTDNPETFSLKLFNYYWSSSSNNVSMNFLEADSDTPSSASGVYFSGSSYTALSSNIIFNNDFYIEMLIKLDPVSSYQTLFCKYSGEAIITLGLNESSELYLSLRMYNTVSNTTELLSVVSASIYAGKWHRISVAVSYSEGSTSISFYDKYSLLSTSNLPDAYFIDVTDDTSSSIVIGARYDGREHTSFYRGFLVSIVSKNTGEYLNSNGRMLKEIKSNNQKPKCSKWRDNGECEECEILAEINEGKCKCIKHAEYEEQKGCRCLEGYINTHKTCRKENPKISDIEKLLNRII